MKLKFNSLKFLLSLIILISTQITWASDSSYTIRESTVDGNTIKEYLNSDGAVFAIRWRGLSHPDLKVMLGTYYPEYHAEHLKQKRSHIKTPTVTNSTHVQIRKGGHMRDVRGLAVVQSLLPTGVSPEDLQ